MNANANIVNLAKGPSNLVRPRFSPGLLLRDDDLRTGVDYTRELSRLLFRSLFGCGVVCGLEVSAVMDCGKLVVTVKQGVALNGTGDPIHVPKDTKLVIDPTCGEKVPPDLWVILCRMEKCCAPRSTVCGCEEEDDTSVCTREQEMFEIRVIGAEPDKCSCICSITELPNAETLKARKESADAMAAKSAKENSWGCACVNPCAPCYRDHYAGTCDCDCCKSECVVLAYVNAPSDAAPSVNHSVRRLVRPVLMRDPVVWKEQNGADLCLPLPDKVKSKAPRKKNP